MLLTIKEKNLMNWQLKTAQNILKILSSLWNDKTNVYCKFKLFTIIRFWITTK